jgi:hypothetical protein
LILSDGWDVGDAELLQDACVARSAGSSGVIRTLPVRVSNPRIQALQLALPRVDDHLDVSSVSVLSHLEAFRTGTVLRVQIATRPGRVGGESQDCTARGLLESGRVARAAADDLRFVL